MKNGSSRLLSRMPPRWSKFCVNVNKVTCNAVTHILILILQTRSTGSYLTQPPVQVLHISKKGHVTTEIKSCSFPSRLMRHILKVQTRMRTGRNGVERCSIHGSQSRIVSQTSQHPAYTLWCSWRCQTVWVMQQNTWAHTRQYAWHSSQSKQALQPTALTCLVVHTGMQRKGKIFW